MVLWRCNSQPDFEASTLASFCCTWDVALAAALVGTNLHLHAWREADLLGLGDVLVVRVDTDFCSL